MDWKESENIQNNSHGELPPDPIVKFLVTTDNGDEKLAKIKQVMLYVAKYDADDWPGDDVWEKELPLWFSTGIMANQSRDLVKETHLWDFSSWVDAMKYRGWYWYSSLLTPKGFEIILVPFEFPLVVNPFEYVIYESGVGLKKIKFEDFM